MLKVLGIDPGLNVTGFGVLSFESPGIFKLLDAGTVRTKPSVPMERRLGHLYEGILKVIDTWQPEAVVIEEVFSGPHPKSALLMGHARGILYLAAFNREVPVASYTASRVKRSLTGNGQASKEQLRAMLQRLLGLSALPRPYDVADALALAFCHINAISRQWRG